MKKIYVHHLTLTLLLTALTGSLFGTQEAPSTLVGEAPTATPTSMPFSSSLQLTTQIIPISVNTRFDAAQHFVDLIYHMQKDKSFRTIMLEDIINNKSSTLDPRVEFEEHYNGFPSKWVTFGKKEFPNASQEIAFLLVHGTFGATSKTYFDDINPTYRAFRQMAANLSALNRCPVHLITFHWTGNLNKRDRLIAGQALAGFINIYFANETKYKIYTFAHSYGAHLVNLASHLISRTINVMYHVAVPINNTLTNPELCDLPQKFDALYNFYSTNDEPQVVATLTAISSNPAKHAYLLKKDYWTTITDNYRIYTFNDEVRKKRTYNFAVRFNNTPPEHTTIRHYPLVNHLISLDALVHTHFPTEHMFDLFIISPKLFSVNKQLFPLPVPVFLIPQATEKASPLALAYKKLLTTFYPEKSADQQDAKSFFTRCLDYLKETGSNFMRKYGELAKRTLPFGFYPTSNPIEKNEHESFIKTSPVLVTQSQEKKITPEPQPEPAPQEQ